MLSMQLSVFSWCPTMEDICKRLPSLANQIFEKLTDQDLIRCNETSKEMDTFLNEDRFFLLRIINAFFGNFVEFKDSWEKVVKKAPTEIIK